MALRIDPGNTKIMNKIKELNEMLTNRLQGSQLSPMNKHSNNQLHEESQNQMNSSQEIKQNSQSDLLKKSSSKNLNQQEVLQPDMLPNDDLLGDVQVQDPQIKQAPKPDLAEKEEPRDIESPRKGTARSHVSEQQEN